MAGETPVVAQPPAESRHYTRLTRADHRTIMKLHDDGLTLSEIARRLSRSVSTIHEVVDIYAPSDDLAKRKLRASALQMAENIVDNGLPRDHVNALKGIGVLEQDRGTDVQLMVGIALPGMPLPQDVGGSPHLPEVSVGSRVITAGSDNPSSVNQPK